MSWIVYKHTSPSNKVYIGITSRDPKRRFCCNGQGYKNNSHFWSAIKKYGWDNFKHEIIKEGLSFDEACETEKRLILEYKSFDSRFGYNIALGGQGFLMTDEQRAEVSDRQKKFYSDPSIRKKVGIRSKEMWADENFHNNHVGEKHPMYGHTHTEEARQKISEARKQLGSPWAKGRVWTEEDRAKMSEAVKKTHPHLKMSDEAKEKERIAKLGSKNPNYGKPMPEGQKQKLIQLNSKPVIQIKEVECIRFSSAAEAGRVTGICSSNITSVCRGERLKAGGYAWKYAE